MSTSRTLIAALALSASAFVGLAVNEGYTEGAIVPTKGDVPTYGFGSTTRADGTRVQMGDKTTPVAALQRSLEFIQVSEAKIKRCIAVPLAQGEYDVYVEMSYNIGAGAFCSSTIVRRLNALDYAGACQAILMWNKVGATDCSVPGNKTCWGLWQRRLDARTKCLAAGVA